MNYVTLRLLGMGPDEGPMTEIRALIHEMGESNAWCGVERMYSQSRWRGTDTILGQILPFDHGVL